MKKVLAAIIFAISLTSVSSVASAYDFDCYKSEALREALKAD